MQYNKLKNLLDNLYLSYKHKFSSKDPVWILHRFGNERDIELTGLITAAYAYGSVDQINRFIDLFLYRIGNKPYEFIINFSKHKDKKYLNGLNYRFNTEKDLVKFICSLNQVLIEFKSLKSLFMSEYDDNHDNILKGLENFTTVVNNYFPNLKAGRSLGNRGEGGRSLENKAKKGYHHYMISSPANGSTCKRMNLFLRWMIRKDEIDTGIWNIISSSKLIIPVDVHIARAAGKLNLVKRKSIDIKYAIELTNKLKSFDPDDPVKYDFSLCHMGIDKKHILSGAKDLFS